MVRNKELLRFLYFSLLLYESHANQHVPKLTIRTMRVKLNLSF